MRVPDLLPKIESPLLAPLEPADTNSSAAGTSSGTAKNELSFRKKLAQILTPRSRSSSNSNSSGSSRTNSGDSSRANDSTVRRTSDETSPPARNEPSRDDEISSRQTTEIGRTPESRPTPSDSPVRNEAGTATLRSQPNDVAGVTAVAEPSATVTAPPETVESPSEVAPNSTQATEQADTYVLKAVPGAPPASLTSLGLAGTSLVNPVDVNSLPIAPGSQKTEIAAGAEAAGTKSVRSNSDADVETDTTPELDPAAIATITIELGAQSQKSAAEADSPVDVSAAADATIDLRGGAIDAADVVADELSGETRKSGSPDTATANAAVPQAGIGIDSETKSEETAEPSTVAELSAKALDADVELTGDRVTPADEHVPETSPSAAVDRSTADVATPSDKPLNAEGTSPAATDTSESSKPGTTEESDPNRPALAASRASESDSAPEPSERPAFDVDPAVGNPAAANEDQSSDKDADADRTDGRQERRILHRDKVEDERQADAVAATAAFAGAQGGALNGPTPASTSSVSVGLPAAVGVTDAAAASASSRESVPTVDANAASTAQQPTAQTSASGTSEEVRTATPADRTQFVERLVESMQQSQQTSREMRIELRPPELGRMEINVTSDDGGVLSARMDVETEAAHRALSESLPALRESLHRLGAAVDRIDVHLVAKPAGEPSGEQHDSSRQDGQQNAQDFGGQAGGNAREQATADEADWDWAGRAVDPKPSTPADTEAPARPGGVNLTALDLEV